MLKIKYKTSTLPVDYQDALRVMEAIVSSAALAMTNNLIWFLEHNALYSAGSSACDHELLSNNLPVYKTNRGGKFTYHGPGQRVVYLVLDLKTLFAPNPPDAKKYVFLLEETIIEILKELDLVGLRIPGSPGIWVKDKKIAFIGIRISKWIAYHGISFNISPELDHFRGIIPCGLKEYEITSLKEFNKEITLLEFDSLFKKHFIKLLKKGI